MNSMFVPALLFYYGVFLIGCGITAVLLIGLKAKTALISGGTSGIITITIGHFISQGEAWATIAGLVLCLFLFGIFCWRSAKTLFTVMDLIPQKHPDLKGKSIAFLIISLMAIVTIVVLVLQLAIMTK
jgi:uncharacterized membrane-anchored protein YitT (DUF2179 family)